MNKWTLLLTFTVLSWSFAQDAKGSLPDPTPNSVEVTEETDECRLVEHALGETCVPKDPQRIVSMDPGVVTDNLIALGRKPVGSVVYASLSEGLDEAFPPAIAGQAKGIESVGTYPGSLERVLALQPDLIIGYPWNFDGTYEQFSEIAPTVAIEDTNDWRTYLTDTARVTGDVPEAQAILEQFYADAAALDERLPDMTVSLLRPRPDVLQVYGTGAEATRVLNAIGLSLTPVPQGATDRWGEDEAGMVSYEVLPEIGGEAFFVIGYSLEPDELGTLQASELWQALPVVKAGRAFNIEGTAWTNHGPNGVYRVMQEVEEALVE